MSIIYIYGLICPIDGQIRYIGKSIRPKERLQNHMQDTSKCHRTHWIQKLRSKGLRPEITILEQVSSEDVWQERERYWIARGKELGWPLTNNTSGGDGVCDLPQEARERIRKTWIGRKHTEETKAKIGATSRLKRHTDEHKAAMSEKMKQRKITWGAKIAESTRKLSAQDQADILDALSSGVKNKDLAEKYGVHRTTISKVKTGRYIVK